MVRLLLSTRVAGDFLGWKPGTKYVLEDGSMWEVLDSRHQKAYAFRPVASVWEWYGRFILRVEDCGLGAVGPVVVRDQATLKLLRRDPAQVASRAAFFGSDAYVSALTAGAAPVQAAGTQPVSSTCEA